jgi:predicted nucleic acid-binding protein
MPIDRVVINASPLITLFRAGLHPLLPQLFSELLVPEAVWNEVVSRTYDDPATRGLPQSAWAGKTASTVDPAVAVWNLGAGETAVLSLSLHSPGYTAIVDDRAARRCARVLDVRTIGTAGVIVLARRKGLIASVEDALRQLQGAGLWLSEDLIMALAAESDS